MTPLVAAAKFHGKDGGRGVGGSLSVSMGVSEGFKLYWHLLSSRDGGKLAAKSVRGLPGSPNSTHSCGVPLPTVNAPLSSASDTDFSKILCRPCVPDACGMQPLLPFQGCWLQNPPRNLRKMSPLGISGG